MEDISNVEKLENSLNKFLQTETHLDDPVRILSVKKTDRAREVTSKNPAKREVKIYFEGQEKQDLKVPILEKVQNKIYKISFSHLFRFGTRFHLELSDESSNVQLSTDDTVVKNKNLDASSSSNSITEDPNNTKTWTETEILRQKGWAVEEIPRKNGSYIDKVYYHLMSGYQFRSMKQAKEFVSEGTLGRRNKSKKVKSKRGKSGILTEPDGIGNIDKEGYGNAQVSINPKTSMEVGNPEEPNQAVLEKKERPDDGVTSENQTETTEETANDADKKETDDVNATVTEEQKDSETVVVKKAKTEETEELAKDVEKGESNEPLTNEKSVVSEVNEGLTPVPKNENDTEGNSSKKHPLIVDEAVTEPELKKIKLEETKPEGEQVIIDAAEPESSAWERPFPPEFYTETETHDCDPGPLWQFDDPYFIELVQEGNPPKDVAYVSLKSDKNKDV